MGTCETPNPPRFAFSRLGPALQHLLWLVRVRTCGRTHGISSIFASCCLFDTLKVEESTDLSQNRRPLAMRAGAQRQAVARQRANRVQFLARKGFASGLVDAPRRRRVPIRSLDVRTWVQVEMLAGLVPGSQPAEQRRPPRAPPRTHVE